MKFGAGDKVRLRAWEELKMAYGSSVVGSINTSPPVVLSMKQYCGREVTITVSNDIRRYYLIQEDNQCWHWPEEAFKHCGNNAIVKNRSTSLAMYLHRKKGTPLEFIEDDSDKIHVGNYVEIVDPGQTYDYYRDWINTHCPEFENDFKEGEVPPVGAIGRVVGKGEHLSRDNMLYGVYIEENDRFSPNIKNGIFCIDESGIKKLKPYNQRKL